MNALLSSSEEWKVVLTVIKNSFCNSFAVPLENASFSDHCINSNIIPSIRDRLVIGSIV